jgi:hypothetical protein
MSRVFGRDWSAAWLVKTAFFLPSSVSRYIGRCDAKFSSPLNASHRLEGLCGRLRATIESFKNLFLIICSSNTHHLQCIVYLNKHHPVVDFLDASLEFWVNW